MDASWPCSHGLCPPPAVPAHISTCLSCCWLALGSVERDTLMPLMMSSTQHVLLLFKEGMGVAQNCSYLLLSLLQGEKGDRGERVSGCAFP